MACMQLSSMKRLDHSANQELRWCTSIEQKRQLEEKPKKYATRQAISWWDTLFENKQEEV